MIEECPIAIVDTPGLFDTANSNNQSMKEVIRCINLSSPGPHIFLLVLKTDRFTEEENHTVNSLFELFGDHMLAFTIIVFTRLSDIEEEGTTIEEYIQSSTDTLKRLIKRVNFRYVAFNNKGNTTEKVSYCSSLKVLIDDIQKSNGGSYYTNDMYKEAEQITRERIRILQKTKEIEQQREVEQIAAKFKEGVDIAEQTKYRLQTEMSAHKIQNINIKNEHQDSSKLVLNMQQKLNKTNSEHLKELQKTVEEKQKIEAKLNAAHKQQCNGLPISVAYSSLVRENESRIQSFKLETRNMLDRQERDFEMAKKDTILNINTERAERRYQMQNQLLNMRRIRSNIMSSNSKLKDQIETAKRIEAERQRQRKSENFEARVNVAEARLNLYGIGCSIQYDE